MMRSLPLKKMLSLAAILCASSSHAVAAQQNLELQLTGQGRFSYFADLASLRAEGDNLRHLRALQLSDPITIGDKVYIGGWSNWTFDCLGRTAQRLDFASLSEDGVIGPVTPTRSTAYALVAGGDAAELAAVACGETPPMVHARTLEEALRLSQD